MRAATTTDIDVTDPILILGMHRSGTSCLTGCLEEAGLYLGNVNTAAPANKKGNRESRAVMDLHDRVLTRAGASWDQPPPAPLTWTEDELSALRTIMDDYIGQRHWGTKDPRVLFTLPGWRALCRPRFIGTYRHPLEVAASLTTRAQAWGTPMSTAHALSLWKAYNAQLLWRLADAPFPLLRYDIPTPEYNAKLTTIAADFGLHFSGPIRFRDPALYHQSADAAPIPDDCAQIWEALQVHAV